MMDRKPSGGMVSRKCSICGRIFQIPFSRLADGRGKFCSRNCQNNWCRSHRLSRKCSWCKSAFPVTLYKWNEGRRYCSKKCSLAARSRHRMDPEYLLSYIKKHCAVDSNGCWLFYGLYKGVKPNPQIKIRGIYYPVRGIVLWAVGRTTSPTPVKGSKVFCCTCGQKSCVNPDHAYLGTPTSPLYHKLDRKYIRALIKERSIADPETGCWWWTGGRSSAGYGQLHVEGKSLSPHRASLWAFGKGNKVLYTSDPVLHSCDNPACVNSAHLRLGTPRENVMDSVARGRQQSVRKTHCPQGHPYSDANTFTRPVRNGGRARHCRTCLSQKFVALNRRIDARISELRNQVR